MRIVEVHPGEELLRGGKLLEPRDRLGGDDVAGSLVRARVEPIGIYAEAARQTGLPVKDRGGNERGGREPLSLEEAGQERNAVAKWR